MGKFDGVLIACDMDGTLLDSRTHDISAETIEKAQYLMREGGRFAFATGRIVEELREHAELVHPNAFCICSNGAVMHDYRSGENREIASYGDDIIPFLEYVEREFPVLMIEPSGETCVYHTNKNDALVHQRAISDVALVPIGTFRDAPRPWYKLAFWAMPDVIYSLEDKIDYTLVPSEYTLVRTYPYCFEMLINSASKGKSLLEYRKIYPDLRLVAAMGDNENDTLMLRNADVGFAVGNAVDGAKEAADIVLTRTCNESALCEAIDRIEMILK